MRPSARSICVPFVCRLCAVLDALRFLISLAMPSGALQVVASTLVIGFESHSLRHRINDLQTLCAVLCAVHYGRAPPLGRWPVPFRW